VTESDAIVLDQNEDQECAQFQASMADLVSNGEDLTNQPHVLTCERCAALVSELEAIAHAARLLMPVDAEPRDDLWSKIAGKLAMESSSESELVAAENEKESDDEQKASEGTSDLEGFGGLAFEGGIA
jgi:hypothetical protein